MSKGKGSFLITLLVMFILFLSMFSVVFNLKGNFFKFELILTIVFLIIAIVLVNSILAFKNRAWKCLLVFFGLNLVNQLVIYFKTFAFMDIVLPLMVTALGFLIALIKIRPEKREEFKIEPYEEPEVKVKEEKKVAKKKPAKKKEAAKKKSKKKR